MIPFRNGSRWLLAAIALSVALAQPLAAQTPNAEEEAKRILAITGLVDQIRDGAPQLAEQLQAYLRERNPGREADIRHAVEAAIMPAIGRRLDELLQLAAQPLLRGFTAEELSLIRRFLELRLDQRLEGALQLVAFEIERESPGWVRKVAEETLAQSRDARLRGLRY
ncbi:DUF2059 domain-containing protein [Elioraea thermophila]|uniref:hypothetical protein n=1 Tax=Elioraea thermophila TaxID=2185104 RepID=UPI000DF285DB|nr:hypothetical protein [Elioraea thermophila]